MLQEAKESFVLVWCPHIKARKGIIHSNRSEFLSLLIDILYFTDVQDFTFTLLDKRGSPAFIMSRAIYSFLNIYIFQRMKNSGFASYTSKLLHIRTQNHRPFPWCHMDGMA